MIQDFKTYISEGTLWGNTILRSDTDRVRKEDDIITEDDVRSFLEPCLGGVWDCEEVTIRKENGKQIVDIKGDFYFKKNLDIERLPFQFGIVTGAFIIASLKNLTSLKGCPKEVGDYFYCDGCEKITSLEGCPEKVLGYFSCERCGKKFTREEVSAHCDTKTAIYV